jgi:hypothetical protein
MDLSAHKNQGITIVEVVILIFFFGAIILYWSFHYHGDPFAEGEREAAWYRLELGYLIDKQVACTSALPQSSDVFAEKLRQLDLSNGAALSRQIAEADPDREERVKVRLQILSDTAPILLSTMTREEMLKVCHSDILAHQQQQQRREK